MLVHPLWLAADRIREFFVLRLGIEFLAAVPVSLWLLFLLVLFGAITLGIVFLFPVVFVLMERKVSAYFQDRLGPTRVGPWGLLVTIADAIKLIFKEDIIPPESDRVLFRFAPYLVFGASVAVASVVPPFRSSLIGNYDLGLFLYLAISSLVVLGIIMAGWASNSKYSLFGAMRAAAQIVSYEIPLGLAVLVVVLATGTLNPQRVVYDQAGGVHHWLIFRQPFLFISAFLYYISAIAEVNRTPFDLPEAESEIVAGFHTEYSGIRFAYFFMAEYTNMVIVSAIATTLFLGGWSGPIPGWDLLPGVVWFALKTVLLVFVMMWLRWTLPRVRVDQLMALCWKYFLPIGLVNVLGTGILELLAQEGVGLTIGGWRIGPNGIAWVVVPVLVALLGVYAFSGGPQPRPAAAPRRP